METTHGTTITPTIQQLIFRKIREHGLSRSQLITSLGYKNISKGLRRFDQFCLTLNAPEEFIQRLITILEIDALSFHKSMMLSLDIMAKRKESEKKERFRPNIEILLDFTPRPLFVYQYIKHCTRAKVPAELQQLPIQEELAAVFTLYNEHINSLALTKFNGSLMQYLKPSKEENTLFRECCIGFRYHRSHKYFLEFTKDFVLSQVVSRPSSPSSHHREPFGNKVMGMIVRTMEGK